MSPKDAVTAAEPLAAHDVSVVALIVQVSNVLIWFLSGARSITSSVQVVPGIGAAMFCARKRVKVKVLPAGT